MTEDTDNETNLSAQEETEKQGPRFSQENEHQVGQERFKASSQSRPQAAYGVTDEEAAEA